MQISTDTVIEAAIGGSGAYSTVSDRLIGNAANSILDGRGGADRVEGGAGNDSYYCTAGDVVIEGTSAVMDRVISFGNLVLAAYVENCQALESAAVKLTGNALNNALTGNGAANVLNGDPATIPCAVALARTSLSSATAWIGCTNFRTLWIP